MSKVTLRPYQEQAVEAVLSDWKAGHTDVLGTAATGSGKTIVFLEVLNRVLTDGQRAMILAHRKDLIEQPIERMRTFYPELAKVAGIVMASEDNRSARVIVGTVQTLASEQRMEPVLRFGAVDYLVTDEAHHSTASTYRSVYRMLREANPQMRHLGVTATPLRADGQGLRQVYQKESFHFGIREMVGNGHLVPPRWLAIKTGISLADVPTGSNGDYVGTRLADVFETDNCFDLVAASHTKYAHGRQAIAFCQSVDGAYRLAQAFERAGISAKAADGTTAKRERGDIMRAFRKGRFEVLVNVGLYTEGLDVPQVSCIHQVRPTKSDGLYIQMIGRGLRLWPGKVDGLVLDYCPVETRNVVMLGDVLGLKERKDAYVRDDGIEPGEALGGFTFDGNAKFMRGSAEQLLSMELDYLDFTPWVWYKGSDGTYSLGLGLGGDGFERTIVVQANEDESFTMFKVGKVKGSRAWQVAEGATADWETITTEAETIAARYAQPALAAKGKSWRARSHSPAQASFGRSLGLAFETDTSMGEAAARITHALALRAIQWGSAGSGVRAG